MMDNGLAAIIKGDLVLCRIDVDVGLTGAWNGWTRRETSLLGMVISMLLPLISSSSLNETGACMMRLVAGEVLTWGHRWWLI